MVQGDSTRYTKGGKEGGDKMLGGEIHDTCRPYYGFNRIHDKVTRSMSRVVILDTCCVKDFILIDL